MHIKIFCSEMGKRKKEKELKKKKDCSTFKVSSPCIIKGMIKNKQNMCFFNFFPFHQEIFKRNHNIIILLSHYLS